MCVSFFLRVLADWVCCGKSVVRSWEPLTLVWGPLHKRTVNKLEGIFILRSKQLNRLLFLDSVMITEIKWKASISEGKNHSLSWTPFWCRWHSAEAAVFILHLGSFSQPEWWTVWNIWTWFPMSQEPQTIHFENYDQSLSAKRFLFSHTKTT